MFTLISLSEQFLSVIMINAGFYFNVIYENLPRDSYLTLFDLCLNGGLVIVEEPRLRTKDGLTHCFFPKMNRLSKSQQQELKMNTAKLKTFQIDIKPSVNHSVYKCFLSSILLHESIHVLNFLDPILGEEFFSFNRVSI